MKKLESTRFFVVGCVLSVSVAGLIIWTFIIGDLTDDQRNIMRYAVALTSGFLAGCFVGSFTVKTRGVVPGFVATATGGFGVWLLTFLFWNAPANFNVIV